jgi:hypothetical protein
MKESKNYTLQIAVAACLAAQLTLAMLVVPPWQNPDEPQHFHTVRLIALYGVDFDLASHHDDRSEEDIVRSMMEHGWWSHYGRAIPDPAPRTFSEGPGQVVDAYFGPPGGGSRLYYNAVAILFRTADISGLLAQLHTMRALSAVCSLLALLCVWRGTRALVDEQSAVVVTALMALHPQFVLVSTTAGPDALVNLAGAAFWWRAGVLMTAPASALNVAWLWACAVLAFLIRRMGAPLLIVAAILTFGRVVSTALHGDRRTVAWTLGLLTSAGVATMLFWPMLPADAHRAFSWIQFDETLAANALASRVGELPRFLGALFTHFWLAVGWVRYQAPWWWYGVIAVVCVMALMGLVLRPRSLPTPRIALFGSMLALQTVAVVAYYFGVMQSGAQGRYLFPVLPAVFALLWVGWRRWFPPPSVRAAAVALIALMAALNALAWLLVVLPVYT